MVVTCLRLWFARRRGAPNLLFVGKSSTMRAPRLALASTRVTARCESALSTVDNYLVALFTADRDGLSGRAR